MIVRYGKEFYKKYKNYVLFNKNIFIAGIAALIVGTFFTQIYSQQNKNNFLNSIVTLSVEYAVYIPLFALFFYLDNKRRYIDPTSGKKIIKILKMILLNYSPFFLYQKSSLQHQKYQFIFN